MRGSSAWTTDRPWLGYAAILGLSGALAIGGADIWYREYDATLQHFRDQSLSQAQSAAQQIETSLNSIYQNIRTLSLLPSVQTIDRHGQNLSDESKLTFQQIYNNLAGTVAVSEVYILPAELHPHRLDLHTGKPQEPILMFDELIVNARDRYLESNPSAEAHDLPTIPEVEIFEYEQMEGQLAWLRANYPVFDGARGLAIPMVSGPEVITCDNTYYLHTMKDADRSGVVFIVPFYGADGAFRGGVAAILLTRALEQLLPSGDFALVNTSNSYAAYQPSGQAAVSQASVRAGAADPGLLFSKVLPLETADTKSKWGLWVGHPDSVFLESAELDQLRTTGLIAAFALALLTAASICVWFLLLRSMRTSAANQSNLEERVAERTAEIQFLATHDALTGLSNRRHFTAQLNQALDRIGEDLAVLALDLDHFKTVNDTLGHSAGDLLLKEVALRLQRAAGEHCDVARFGGDEFVIMATGLSGPYQAEQLARRCIEALSQPIDLNGPTARVGVSVGIALAPADASDAEQLLRNADIALYRAKGGERGTFRFFERAMDAELQKRHKLEADLQKALERGELAVHYQPLVNADDETVTGFEALVRWKHPERGLLAPSEFIPLAEDCGLIQPLGEWVLRTACTDAAGWPAHLKVAVNLSPAQFRQQTLAHTVVAALDESGLTPSRLELEITETALLLNNEQTLRTLHQIKALGVRIAMDDFGTGFSSLSYLRSFPFDRIKIDRSFVSELETSSDCRAIVTAVVALGQSLGIATTAEGIENDAQLRLVRDHGCTDLQGFYFGKATSAEEVMKTLGAATEKRLSA